MPCDPLIFTSIILDEIAETMKALAAIGKYIIDAAKDPKKIIEDIAETDAEQIILGEIKSMIKQAVASFTDAVAQFVYSEISLLYQRYIGKYLDQYAAYIQLGMMGLDILPMMIAYTVTVIQGLLRKEIEYLQKIINNLNIIIYELQSIGSPTDEENNIIINAAMTAKELLIRANNELIDAQSLAENCENYELLRRKMDSARRNLRSVLCVLDLKRFGYKVDSFEEISKIAHRHERFKETMKQWYEATKADAIQRLNMYKESGMRIANALQEITVTFGRDYFPNHIKLLGQLRMYTFLRLMLLGQLRYVDCKLEKARLKVSWHNKIIETSINKLDEVINSPYKYCYLFPFVTASTSALLEALKDFRQSVTEELKAQVQKTDIEAYIYSDTYTRVTDQMRRLPNLIKAFKSIDRATKDLEMIKRVVINQLNWATKLSSELSNVASLSNEQLLQLEQLLSKVGVSPADFQQFLAGDAMGNTMSILGYSMYGFNTLLDCLGQSPSAVIAEVEERLRPKLMKNKTQKDSVSGSLTESKAQLSKSVKNLQEAYKKMISTFSKLKAPKVELPPLLPGQFMA